MHNAGRLVGTAVTGVTVGFFGTAAAHIIAGAIGTGFVLRTAAHGPR